jgi:mannosyltransferase OCH1-like enzyme
MRHYHCQLHLYLTLFPRSLFPHIFAVRPHQIIVTVHGLPSPIEGNKWHDKPMRASTFFEQFRNHGYALFAKELNADGTSATLSYILLHSDFWKIDKSGTRAKHSGKSSRAFSRQVMDNNLQYTTDSNDTNLPTYTKPSQPLFILKPRNMEYLERAMTNASFAKTRDLLVALSGIPSVAANPFIQRFVPQDVLRATLSNHTIPRIMIFTYQNNLLETKDPPLLYANVIKTIAAYREAWNDTDAPYWVLTDEDCARLIYKVRPSLLQWFVNEEHGSHKGDICRAAALYLVGGYYFDVDLRVVEPIIMPPHVTFSTVGIEHNVATVGWFFQAFLAAAPGHVIMTKTLDFIDRDDKDNNPDHSLMGPQTMKQAYDSLTPEESGEMYFFEEISIEHNDTLYPELTRQNGRTSCNFVVHDKKKHVVHFFSRILGVPLCVPNWNFTPIEQPEFVHQMKMLTTDKLKAMRKLNKKVAVNHVSQAVRS